MKTKNLSFATFIALAALLVASCSIPDYQLGWETGFVTQSASTISVPYTVSNIGYEKLYDVTIRISVDTDVTTYSTWTTQVNLDVGESKSGTAIFYVTGTYVSESEAVTGAGWNAESKTW